MNTVIITDVYHNISTSHCYDNTLYIQYKKHPRRFTLTMYVNLDTFDKIMCYLLNNGDLII